MAFNIGRRVAFELLEDRRLLAGDIYATAPIADINQLAALFANQGADNEVRLELTQMGLSLGDNENLSDIRLAQQEYYDIQNNAVLVSVMGTGTTDELLEVLEAIDFSPQFVSADQAVADGFVDLGDLYQIIDNPGIAAIIPLNPKLLSDSVGSVANAAENVLRGSTLNQFQGLTGSGITIGVISNGIGGLATSQGNGNLPISLSVLSAGTGAEGTAMLELIHDIAPGANLAFHAAGTSEASFASAVNSLVSAGVDIIVDDINGLGTESFFADGLAATAIDNAVTAGVTVFSSAGNRGDNGYESISRFVASQNVLGNVGTFHDFSGTGDFLQTVTSTDFGTFQLQFDQLFGNVTSNIRLWVFQANGSLIGTSTQTNNIIGNPNDQIGIIGSGTVQLAIELVTGSAPSRMKWINFGDVNSIEHDSVAGALRTARNPGHAAAANNISVGTTDYMNPLVRRDYSGVGQATRSLTPAGTAMPLQLRGGPTLMGVDGTNTSVNQGTNNNFLTFFGTSAAAPNVAAIAALLLEADPSLTPAEIRSALTTAARDIDAIGVDLTSGAGVVDALGSLGVIQGTPQLVGLSDNEYIVVNVTTDALDTNGDPNIIDVSPSADNQVSLRAAIVNANITAETEKTILVPSGLYNLTLTGTGGTTQGDLDITGNVTIVGAGAGATIIDAGGSTGLGDRLFEVNGASRSLSLSRMTLTGGNASSTGGAINVASGGTLELEQVAVVGNQASGQGGGVYIGPGSSATVQQSVITDNTAGTFGGGLISAGTTSAVSVGSSIFAKNTAPSGRIDFRAANGSTAVDLGNNLIGVWDNDQTELSTINGNLLGGTPDYIVTSIVDSYDANRSTDLVERSLREAVDRANQDDGQASGDAEEIWLPAWKFVLTRDRGTHLTDTDTGYGDLDIIDSLKVRGVTGFTSVEWRPGVVDAIFDLLGDFDGTGLVGDPDGGSVNGRDFLRWQQQAGQGTRYQDYEVYSADANDDGHVDSDDNDIRALNYGNTLEILPSVNVILA